MQNKHVEVKTSKGWGIAALVVVGAIAINSLVAYIHYSTYKAPTDIHFRAAGTAPAGHESQGGH